MTLKNPTAAPSCRGECCRNPYGVCTHRRACAYHKPQTPYPPRDVLAALRYASARRLLEREAGR